MAEIEQSLPEDNCKSENTDFTNLKQTFNVNVKYLRSFKWDIFHKWDICHKSTLLILLSILSIVLIIIASRTTFFNETTQNTNAEQIFKMYEQKYETYDQRIKDLELQMRNVMLRFKHNEQNSNSIQYIQSMDYSESKSESTSNSADLLETKNNRDDSNTTSKLNDLTIPSASVQSLDQNNELKSNISKILDIYPIKLNENNTTQSEIDELSRQKRTLKTQNHTITEDERNNNNTANVQTKLRAIKGKRNRKRGGKGKKRQKKKEKGQGRGRPERNRRRLGPKVATFIGAIPVQPFENTVNVGPWIKSDENNSILPRSYHFTKFYLREEDYAIEVNMGGLYMISVQIFYFGKPVNHSYWVLLNPEGSSRKRKLITCTTGLASDVTCYTGVTTYLQTGDRLIIQQQEKNRLVDLREGHSQIQLVLLANDKDED